MSVSIPRITGLTMARFTGSTSEIGPNGMSADYRSFSVTKTQDYNFKITNPQTSFTILDSKNQVVASGVSGDDVAEAHARLGPGQYTAIISQRYKGVNNRDYELDVSERANGMLTAGGTILKGQARQATGSDTGVQHATLTVAQGGTFSADLSMPYSRWAIMDKQGKVVASGDTMNPDSVETDLTKKDSFKISPGEYDVVLVFPRNIEGEIPWNLNIVPNKVAGMQTTKTKQTDVERILAERQVRLQQWAAEDVQKSAASATSTLA